MRYPLSHAFLPSLEIDEPTCFSQASKHPHCHLAMTEQMNALLRNQTWSHVPSHPRQNIIGCKWVFRIKRNLDGSVERYQACYMAKDFRQRPNIDYAETFRWLC